MFGKWIIRLGLMGPVFFCSQSFVHSQCQQNCFADSVYCYTNPAGKCLANKCYYYYVYDNNNKKQSATSCYECGGPGAGTCNPGAANLTCVKSNSMMIKYQYLDVCNPFCN